MVPEAHDPSLMRLADLLGEYLEDLRHRVTPCHYRNVELRLTHTLAALAVDTVKGLEPLVVLRYRNRLLGEGLSRRTANLVVDNLRTMLGWAQDCGLVNANPLTRIRRLPEGAGHQRCVRRALSDGEIERFLAAAEADDARLARTWQARGGEAGDHRRATQRIAQAPLWRAFLETGARWSELTRIDWGDVDGEKRTLLLRAENTKAKRRRIVPLGTSLLAILNSLRETHGVVLARVIHPGDPVFLTPEAVRWCRQTNNAMRIFNRLLLSAGIPRIDAEGRKLDIHALRHTFGSRLARSGAGLVHVQRLLGHSDPKLTAQVYTHLDVEDLRSAIESAIGR
jgi:integrase